MASKVVVLGGTGMLGSVVADIFSRDSGVKLTATARTAAVAAEFSAKLKDAAWRPLDAEKASVAELRALLQGHAFAVNCIGIIKPYIHDDNSAEVQRALRVNGLFPHLLAEAAAAEGVQVMQIATDCVYSGTKGSYLEKDTHDALDAYGKTKSLGEVVSANMHHVRGSIIGPEPRAHVSLLDWFLGQAKNAKVKGFSNHRWNGVTTLAFARVCLGAVKNGLTLRGTQHLLASAPMTKAAMLHAFAEAFSRTDISIETVEAGTVIDRTLSTSDPAWNTALWQAAGYAAVPSVGEMIKELSAYRFGA